MTKAEKTRFTRLSEQIARLSRQIAQITENKPKANHDPMRRTYRPWTDRENIRRLRAMGFSDDRIGAALGCSGYTANRYRHRFGFHDSLASKRWS
jgi:hypothetical protein